MDNSIDVWAFEPVIGVCVETINEQAWATGLCSKFVQVNNLALDSNNFDWDLFQIYIGGSLGMWVTGLSLGYIIKMIKKGSRF